jgi:hypothetical protein
MGETSEGFNLGEQPFEPPMYREKFEPNVVAVERIKRHLLGEDMRNVKAAIEGGNPQGYTVREPVDVTDEKAVRRWLETDATARYAYELGRREAEAASPEHSAALDVRAFDQQSTELIACELTLVDTVTGTAVRAIRTSDVRSFVDALRDRLTEQDASPSEGSGE